MTLPTVVTVAIGIFAMVICTADAFPSGAPAGTCLNLSPQHDGQARPDISPYRLETDRKGNEVHIHLVGSEPFRGFLLNARYASDPQRIVPGTFTSSDPSAQTLDCIGERDSGLTHNDRSDKSAVHAVWVPPADFNGPIIFMAGVVKSFNQFWSNIQSTEVNVRGSGKSKQETRIPDHVYDNCEKTEGCFSLPANCIYKKSCDVMLGYREEPGTGYIYKIVSVAGKNRYVAIGLSADNLMGDDAVIECVDIQGRLYLRESWNKAGVTKGNELQTASNVRSIDHSSIDGVQTCQWTLPYITIIKSRTYDLRKKFYVLLASGKVLDNGEKRHHDAALASFKPVDFSALKVEQGDNSQLWVQAHASLMIFAWLFAASLGMMLARHYKNVWEDKMPCGVKMWFACHRVFMVLTLLMSLTGVAVMVYRFGIFTKQSGWHPIFGLVCVALCILQPIMALFRCHPGARHRPLFNWAHWFVGNAAQIFGVVAIFLAVDLPKAGLQNVHWFIWLVVAFVIFHVLCHLVLQIHGFSVDKRVSIIPDIQLQTVGSSNVGTLSSVATSVDAKDPSGSNFKRFILGLYIVGLLFIDGAIIAVLWLTGSDFL